MTHDNLPKKGDKLFDDQSVTNRDFHLGSIMWGWDHFGDAYKLAADMLIERYDQDLQRFNHDDLVFPVAYLYRHAVEIKLKRIVRYGVILQLYTMPKVEDILGGHNLANVWDKANLCIRHVFSDGDTNAVSAAESMINELHQIDKTGQALRYGRDKKTQESYHYEFDDKKKFKLKSLPEWVSIKTLRNNFDKLITFLDGCIDGIDQATSSVP